MSKLLNIKQGGDADLGALTSTSFSAGAITGTSVVSPTLQITPEVAAANGAISPTASLVLITKAGVAAMTLANPSASQNGHVMTIVSTTAHAHTVTNTSGFNSGGAASDVGTFGAAAGNAMQIVAYNQRWWTIALTNVTLD